MMSEGKSLGTEVGTTHSPNLELSLSVVQRSKTPDDRSNYKGSKNPMEVRIDRGIHGIIGICGADYEDSVTSEI
jgi:hypothetical protein